MFKFEIFNAVIPTVTEQKILGLIIDNNFTWRNHIEFVCLKLSRLLGLFYRIYMFLNRTSKLLFYNSYILPYIDYCLILWNSAPKDAMEKAFRLQKRAARLVLNVPRMTSSLHVFSELRLLCQFTRELFI